MHYLREKASQKWMNKRRTEINNEISNSRDLSKSMDLFTKWVTYTTLSEKQQQVHLKSNNRPLIEIVHVRSHRRINN